MITETGRAGYAKRRAAMAEETRTRILAACVEILGRGVGELSIPAVAREAGVSVPTVYRNFPDKKTLVRETAAYLRTLRRPEGVPRDLADVPEVMRREFERAASLSETVRAAIASEPILATRRAPTARAERMRATEVMLADVLRGKSAEERRNAIAMTAVLCSTWTLRGFTEIVGASPREAADVATWALGRILGQPLGGEPPARGKRDRRRP